MYAVVGNLVHVGRPPMQATHYELLRSKRFDGWQEVTYAS
jgi:hypothetical protein